MNMYVMLMLMLWDVNACLTPRGVTFVWPSSSPMICRSFEPASTVPTRQSWPLSPSSPVAITALPHASSPWLGHYEPSLCHTSFNFYLYHPDPHARFGFHNRVREAPGWGLVARVHRQSSTSRLAHRSTCYHAREGVVSLIACSGGWVDHGELESFTRGAVFSRSDLVGDPSTASHVVVPLTKL
jgi:hypothetical protein